MPRKPRKPARPNMAEGRDPPDGGGERGRDNGGSFPIVGIGASAGGLEAFTQFLRRIPADTGMAFVLVQHLDPEHESALSQILARATSLPVREITNRQKVEPNCVYVIPPDTTLRVERGVLKLGERPHTRAPHRPIDSFFESLSQDQGERAIGVVLSGTANDGTQGLEAIKAAGGITFAQDHSAKHDSMPRSAVAAGVVDFVLSPAETAEELARIAQHPLYREASLPLPSTHAEANRTDALAHEDDSSPLPSGGHAAEASAPLRDDQAQRASDRTSSQGYRDILSLLYDHSGVDFSLYRSTTIQRRIARRLVVNNKDTPDDYAAFLRGNANELDALFSDVLIGVTTFFRNPEMFDALQQHVFPKLLAEPTDEPVRCWVLGCSTGQEAYSLAMTYVESAEKAPRRRRLQIFATDLNEKLLEKARQARYARTLAQDLAPQRLQRFFVEEQGGYRVGKMLRDMVVFARQNLISDPPFSRMDIISCRNLLIYLEPTLQSKALPTFHYALNPGGFLLLGVSESVGEFTDLFQVVDRKFKIFTKKSVPTAGFHLPVGGRSHQRGTTAALFPALPGEGQGASEVRRELNGQREADRVAIRLFAPPSVLINDQLQVLQFRGPTGAYLEPPAGKATFNVLKMAREGLMLPLRTAITQARQDEQAARVENVRVKREGATALVDITVIPLKNMPERCFLVVFQEASASNPQVSPECSAPPASRLDEDEARTRIAELETELTETREYLQIVQDQHEAANEELQAANEEAQSANEELQSINEELETSKEELESANEELTTVNEEMSHRNVELSRLHNDLLNLQTSAKLPVILLALDLTIRRFSAQAERQWGLVATDVGRPVAHLRHSLVGKPHSAESGVARENAAAAAPGTPLDLERIAADVIGSGDEWEGDVSDRTGHWYSLRLRPYVTHENKVDGVVLLLVDVDTLKRSELALADARDYAQNTIDTVRNPMLVLDRDLRVESANPAFYREFQVTPGETIGTYVFDLGNQQWNIPALRKLLGDVVPRGATVEDFLVEHEFPSIGRRVVLVNARRIVDPHHRAKRILLAIEDITERRDAEIARQAVSNELANELAATQRLQEISGLLVASSDLDGLYRQITDAAAEIMHADMASMQVVDEREDALRLLAYRGFEPAFGQSFELTRPNRGTPCSEARRRGRRVIVPDVETCDFMRDVPVLVDFRNIAVRAVQSTPLFSRSGAMIGMISTHWRRLHTPPESDLRQLDILARMAADVVERKQFEVDKSRLAAIVDSSDDAIISKDLNGIIITWNQGAQHLFGYSAEEVIGKPVFLLIPEDHRDEEPRILERLRRGESVEHHQTVRRRKDGCLLDISLTISPIRDASGRVIGASKIARDITARVAMEHRIKEQAEALAAESRRKDEFLAMLSHELRNPLAPIRSAVHLLRLHEQPGSERTLQHHARDVIERQVANLTKLVSDLLEVSRFANGRIRIDRQTVDLNQVIAHAVETATPIVEQRQHELVVNTCPEPNWCDIDATRMEEVFVNLLVNAAKYTPDGGRIEVWCESLPDLNQAQVRVRDNGTGIDRELLPRIFDLFTQADRSLARSAGGLGIGLSLAHRIVVLHGGTIEAHSPPQGAEAGTELIVRLTLTSTPPEASFPAPAAEKSPEAEGRRVLVVDDNMDSATMLAVLLQHSGYLVQTAYSGPDALKTALQWSPDIVLLDIGLPGFDGYEVARRLRSDPVPGSAGETMRLVALTGYGRDADVESAKEAGFDAHMTKPIDLADLEKVMARFVSA